MLRNTGLQIDTAGDGREALEAVEHFPYDLVLMDVRMPDMDGVEATARIRALGNDRGKIPVIALTANAMRGDREAYMEQGFNDYLSKPVEKTALLDMLSQWLPTRSQVETGAERDREPATPRTLDVSTLEQLARDTDAALIPTMIDAFVRELDTRRGRIEEALAAGDLESAGREAHTIVGAASFFGAPKLRATARELEHRCVNNDASGANAMLLSFGNKIEEAATAFRKHIAA
jgi:CheY-like chemotaxis protein/HPt (histidine-containing phosphotransfer) domain-containing protein